MRVLAVVALVVASCLSACGGSANDSVQETDAGADRATDTRELAPPTAGESLDGQAIALGDFRGRPVLVNVWSSW